jgi:murein L,D-transpeptidase YcbB/YkuD
MRAGIVLTGVASVAIVLGSSAAWAAKPKNAAPPPTSILPPMGAPDPELPAPKPVPPVEPSVPAVPVPVPPAPVIEVPPPEWSLDAARALITVIDRIGGRGLFAKDYDPVGLRAAIAAGPGAALNEISTRQFKRLALDLRDGRTPQSSRVQWLVKDTDAISFPVDPLLAKALETRDISGVLSGLEPQHPDYAVLRDALAATADPTRQKLIRANMDRWRWLPNTLGNKHMIANVPEFRLRVVTYGKVIATYPVIAGKPTTPTPQLNAVAKGVVIHPPWYLPQSVLKEGVASLIANNPAAARAKGYTWTGSGKTLAVVQKSGPNSALGVIKVDMPNAESIFIHDTPSRHLFGGANQALSHGCLRTERAMELGILLGILQGGGSAEELAELIKKGKTERVPFKEALPVYIGYFTLGTGTNGVLQAYNDVYGRDKAVFASFDQPRVEKAAAAPKPAPEKPDMSEKAISEQKPPRA